MMKLKNAGIIFLLCILAINTPVFANGEYDPFFGKDMIYKNDFSGFVSGTDGYSGCTFTNDSKNGCAVGAVVDELHGTSMKLDRSDTDQYMYVVDGSFNIRRRITSGKYVFESEIYLLSELNPVLRMTPYSGSFAGSDFFSISLKKIKAGNSDDENLGWRGEVRLGEWNKIQVLLDIDAGTYITYLNGKQLDAVQPLNLSGNITKIAFQTFRYGDMVRCDAYIDNVCFYKIDEDINTRAIDWQTTVKDRGEIEVVFSDDIDPALINKNNIVLCGANEQIDYEITGKSAFGFVIAPESALNDEEYELRLNNIFGISGKRLTENSIKFRSTAGTYQYVKDKQSNLETEVMDNTVTVINKTGTQKSYVLLTAYYKEGKLYDISSISGVSLASEVRKGYSIQNKDGYEVKAFIIDRGLSDIYFN